MIEVRNRRVWALGAILLASVSTEALAQSTQNLGTMVISANRVETAADQVGSAVTVITAEELEKKQAVTLEDALKEVPGLYVYSNGNPQNRTRVSLRGQDAQHIVFLVDGVKIENQASSMYSNPYNHLQASDIERIEVLRGNQSALYGSDAIGGVVLITTKSGRDSAKMIEGETSVEAGSFETRKATAMVRGRIEDVYYKVSGTRFETGGFDTTKKFGMNEDDGSSSANLNMKVGADVLKDVGVIDLLNLEANHNHQHGWADYDTASEGGSASSPTANKDSRSFIRQSTDTTRFQAKLDLFDGLLGNVFAFNRMDSDVYVSSRGITSTRNPNRYFGELEKYEYQGTLRPVEDHTFVFGAEQERDHYRSQLSTVANSRTASQVNSSVFGDWGMAFLDKSLNFNLGTRQDFHDTFGQHNTYRATASYSVRSTGTRPHASYGTGFKAPMLVQLYGSSGTPTLKPEESTGFDVGVEQLLLDDRLRLDVTAFKTNMTNQIVLQGGVGGTYKNLSSTRAMGLETSASFEANRELSLSATHTYTESRDFSSDAEGGQIDYVPKHAGSLRVDYAPDEVPGLRAWTRMNAAAQSFVVASVAGHKEGRVGNGGYTTWDVGADYEVDEMITVYGRVLNLFDKDYGQMAGFTSAGINGYAGVKVKF